jgi:hypothetical protein
MTCPGDDEELELEHLPTRHQLAFARIDRIHRYFRVHWLRDKPHEWRPKTTPKQALPASFASFRILRSKGKVRLQQSEATVDSAD